MPDIGGSEIYVGGGLGAAGSTINGFAAEIMGELNALRAKLQPLIDTWQAQASSFYQERMLEWDQAAISLFGDQAEGGVLGTIAHTMNVNYGNYTGAEEANIRTWQS